VNDRGRRRFLTKAGGALLAGAVCAPTWPDSPHRVTIEKMAFSPPVLEISRGQRVEWHNADLVPHTVTDTARQLDSGPIEPGATWAHAPEEAGEYSYVCTFHPTMKGVLKVR